MGWHDHRGCVPPKNKEPDPEKKETPEPAK